MKNCTKQIRSQSIFNFVTSSMKTDEMRFSHSSDSLKKQNGSSMMQKIIILLQIEQNKKCAWNNVKLMPLQLQALNINDLLSILYIPNSMMLYNRFQLNDKRLKLATKIINVCKLVVVYIVIDRKCFVMSCKLWIGMDQCVSMCFELRMGMTAHIHGWLETMQWQ